MVLHKKLFSRWKRWVERGVFPAHYEGLLVAKHAPKPVMIDATYLKAHCTASSRGVRNAISTARSAA